MKLNLMKKSTLLCFLFLAVVAFAANAAPREFYEIRVYHFKTAEQQTRTENYLEKAFIPAMHRMGKKKIGIFKPVETDTTFGKKLYVLIPFNSMEEFVGLTDKLAKDKVYAAEGTDYIDAKFDNPPYDRIEKIVLKAFSGMPQSAVPNLKSPVSERVYELRSYEGHTEKIYQNKVKMFNDGDEVGLFKRLNFNAVFYGEVLSGTRMPNLMYMTTFENQADRDAHWKAFSADAQWKTLSVMPEYQKNVSKNVQIFLRPTQYSDL
jgi:hypothetical protein